MKILTINGGGALGVIPAYVLKQLEAHYKKSLKDVFNMFGGVSTGSIISSLLSLGMSAADIFDAYVSLIPEIFGKTTGINELWEPKYNTSKLEKHVKELVKGTFKDVNSMLMMHAVCISDAIIDLKFWKSWDENDKQDCIADAVIASCSAPTYFKPKVISSRTFVDGGIASNDISMSALADALKMGHKLESVSVLNISPSMSFGFKHPEDLGGLNHWIKKIIPLLMDASAPMSRYQCRELLGDRYMNIAPSFNHPLDTTDIKLLISQAEILWNDNGDAVIKFIDSMVNE